MNNFLHQIIMRIFFSKTLPVAVTALLLSVGFDAKAQVQYFRHGIDYDPKPGQAGKGPEPRSECMEGGTLLYKQDFGGNDVSDPEIPAATLLPPGSSDIPFRSSNFSGGGYYTLTKNPYSMWSGFHNTSDHTSPEDKTRGYLMAIDPSNGDLNKILYQADIDDLCDGMTLSFTAWFMNLNSSNNNPKIEMQMVNKVTSDIIISTGTVEIPKGASWRLYGFDFTLPPGVQDVKFKIINKENSTAGNDLGIDDIEIRFCTPPVIIELSDEVTGCEGLPFTLKGEFEDDGTFGNNLAYRWEYSATGNINEPSDWQPVMVSAGSSNTGEVTSSYMIPSLSTSDAGYYRFIVSASATIDMWACRSASTVVHLSVDPASVGGTLSSSQFICIGSNLSDLTLSNKTGAVVKWQYSDDNFEDDIHDIANTSTLLTSAQMGNLTANTYYRAVVQNGVCPEVYSDTVLVTVNSTSVGGNVTPSDTTVCYNSDATLTLSNYMGKIQWQSSTNGVTFTNTGGADASPVFNTPNLTVPAWYRAVIISGVCPGDTSDVAEVTISATSFGGNISSPQTICSGSAPTNLNLSGNIGNVVKWQYSTDNFATSTDIANITTTLTGSDMGSLTTSTYYRAIVKNGVCSEVYSDTVLITVDPSSFGGNISASQTICNGHIPSILTLSGKTGNLLKWQYSDDNFAGDVHDIANTATTLTGAQMGSLTANRYYRVVVQSGVCPLTYSDTVSITIDPISVGGNVSMAQTICSGEKPNDLTLSGKIGDVLRWQYSDDNFFSDSHDIANTATTLTSAEMGSLTANRHYRAVVQSSDCDPAYSNHLLITVDPISAGGVISPSDTTVCLGSNLLLTLSGYVGAIQWQSSATSSTAGFVNIAGQTTPTLNTGTIAVPTWFRAVVTNSICGNAASKATAIQIIPDPTITLTSAAGTVSQTLREGGTLANITYSTKNVIGVTVTNLPPGINYVWLNDVLTISGIPTDTGTFNYTITATGICKIVVATGTIIIKEACPVTVHDAANNITYNVVELVGFCWYKENMYGAKYQDETNISFAQPYVSSLYPNTAQNTIDFGLLYTYEDLTGGTLCPAGWRLPTTEEWALLNQCNINDLRNPTYWLQSGNNTNILDFDARGAGYFNGTLQRFDDLYGCTAWWSSNASTSNNMTGFGVIMNYYCSQIEIVEIMKGDAISVRCLHE